jgi:uncharacterized cupredoxin-like copper-binding protein
MEYEFGDPMEAADVSRVIEVTANDDFALETRSRHHRRREERSRSGLTNARAIPHDFTLGDARMQDEHEAEMAEMSSDVVVHDRPDAFILGPDKTKEVTWDMKQAGEILVGCHQLGHCAAGMKGTIAVEG